MKNRLKTHKDNVNAVLHTYRAEMQRVRSPARTPHSNRKRESLTPVLALVQVDGNRPKEAVFADIDSLLAGAGAEVKEEEVKEEEEEEEKEEVGPLAVAR